MLNDDTQLMVRIFQKVFQLEDSEERDPVKYVKTYKSEIEEADRLFECLGLAKPDTQSALGWRPTPALMEIVANRTVRRAKPVHKEASAEDRRIIWLLCDAASGEARSRYPLCAFSVLRALGLVRETHDDGDLPTLELRELFAEAYCNRKAKKAKPNPKPSISPRLLVIGVPNRRRRPPNHLDRQHYRRLQAVHQFGPTKNRDPVGNHAAGFSFCPNTLWKLEWRDLRRRSGEIAFGARNCSIHHRPRRTFRKQDFPQANSPFSKREARRF
jgi:hypothetical protein